MRRVPSLMLLLLCLGPGLIAAAPAKNEKAPADAPPQLISTKGGGPKWKNFKELTAFAAKGDPQACFELGAHLLDGDTEAPIDPVKARLLLEQAAQGGVPDALFRLGKIYHDGPWVPRDYAKALEYYTAAARRGVPEAQHNIGAMLVSARGVKRDYVEGLAWIILAKKSGDPSDAEAQVRTRLAQRPADIKAAEARADELGADLPNATVRTGTPSAPAPTAPAVTVTAPKIDAAARPKITVPLEPITTAPAPPKP